MIRRASIPAVAAVAAAAAAALVAADEPRAVAPKAAHGSAELIDCTRGRRAVHRRAVFRGEMTQIQPGLRMQMRFRLGEKVGRSPWVGLRAPGIEVWREARPGITRFAHRQRVVALRKGTSYRAEIDFRWLDAEGREVRRESERSPACRQPGRLPNLKLRAPVEIAPGPTPDTRRYRVRVGNTGTVTTRGIELRLLVDGAELDVRRIGRLDAGDRRTIRFVGPACGDRLVAQIDPRDLIGEITERDNAMRTPCPSP